MFNHIGYQTFSSMNTLGKITGMFCQVFARLFQNPHLGRRTVEQILQLGIKSIPVTLITSAFVGMVFSVQIIKEFIKFGAGEMVGGIVGIAIWRELCPLITGVIVAGRVGAAIAAELEV